LPAGGTDDPARSQLMHKTTTAPSAEHANKRRMGVYSPTAQTGDVPSTNAAEEWNERPDGRVRRVRRTDPCVLR
jgi:hypothetical protein